MYICVYAVCTCGGIGESGLGLEKGFFFFFLSRMRVVEFDDGGHDLSDVS